MVVYCSRWHVRLSILLILITMNITRLYQNSRSIPLRKRIPRSLIWETCNSIAWTNHMTHWTQGASLKFNSNMQTSPLSAIHHSMDQRNNRKTLKTTPSARIHISNFKTYWAIHAQDNLSNSSNLASRSRPWHQSHDQRGIRLLWSYHPPHPQSNYESSTVWEFATAQIFFDFLEIRLRRYFLFLEVGWEGWCLWVINGWDASAQFSEGYKSVSNGLSRILNTLEVSGVRSSDQQVLEFRDPHSDHNNVLPWHSHFLPYH